MTISELARRLGTTVRALRYYEDARILRPDRSCRNARRYGPAARIRASIIVALRRANLPLRNIEAALLNDGFERGNLISLLSDQLSAAEAHVREVQTLLAAVESGVLTDISSTQKEIR